MSVNALNNHPTAETILVHVRKRHPNIASGTVYNVLETLFRHKLIKKVTTDKDIMRYDGRMDHHHHIYCTECDIIEDYLDDELNGILKQYFMSHQIKGFNINDYSLQIKGTFTKCNNEEFHKQSKYHKPNKK